MDFPLRRIPQIRTHQLPIPLVAFRGWVCVTGETANRFSPYGPTFPPLCSQTQ